MLIFGREEKILKQDLKAQDQQKEGTRHNEKCHYFKKSKLYCPSGTSIHDYKGKKTISACPLGLKMTQKNKSREDDEKILLGAPGSVVNTRSANPKVLG